MIPARANTDLLGAALAYADAGLYVHPVRPRDKVPPAGCSACHATRCPGPDSCRHLACHGLLDATRRRDVITTWWSRWPAANIGVACGPSGLVVIDLDGPAGVEQWRQAIGVRATARTLTATTPSGGAHLWYSAHPATPCRSTVRTLAPDIDTRATGGYVVAPPSVRRDGTYRWTTAGLPDMRQLVQLPVVPDWILDALDRHPIAPVPTSKPPAAASSATGRHAAYVRAAVEAEVQAVMDARPGHPSGRNSTLNRSAYVLGQLVGAGLVDRTDVVTALSLAAEAVGLGPTESSRTITSGITAGVANPRRMPA